LIERLYSGLPADHNRRCASFCVAAGESMMVKGEHWKAPAAKAMGNGTPFQSVALAASGRRRAGAYQAGVYEALFEKGVEPNWVAGISIRAINSAIIAGNAPKDRVAKLRAFWEGVSANTASWTDMLPHLAGITMLRGALNHLAAGHALFTGVPGFFYPRWLPPFLSPTHTADATSWYDTSPIRSTLESSSISIASTPGSPVSAWGR
jgi:NTE family protein